MGSKHQHVLTDGSAAVAESPDVPKEPPRSVVANTASSTSQQDMTDADTLPEPQEKLAHAEDVQGPLSAQHNPGESGITTLHCLPCFCLLSQEYLRPALPCPALLSPALCTLCVYCNLCTDMTPTLHDRFFENAKAEHIYIAAELKFYQRSQWQTMASACRTEDNAMLPSFTLPLVQSLFQNLTGQLSRHTPKHADLQDVMWTLFLT